MKRHAKALAALTIAVLCLGASTASAAAPVVSIDPASSVKATVAHLSGEVNPEEKETSCRFEYTTQDTWEAEGNSFAGASQIGCNPSPLTGNTAQGVQADLESLSPETTYHLRLVAENEDGTQEAIASNFPTEALNQPEISTPLSVSSITASTAHFSAQIDPKGSDPKSATNWHFSCEPNPCPKTKSGTVPPGGAQVVATDTLNLIPNTEYTVTLHASNGAGSVEESKSFKTEAAGPIVKAFAAGPVQATQASLNGQINPQGSATEYWFEWGSADCSANPCQAIPATKDADAGPGGLYVYVSRVLSGLSPETTYHFRLIAKNATGMTEGADEQFTTASLASETQGAACANSKALGASQLPDCRAWEMVSPPDKNGGEVAPVSDRVHAAADGDGLAFASLTAFGDAQGTAFDTEYLAERDAAPETNGWSTHGITPKQSSSTAIEYPSLYQGDFSADLSRAVYRSWRPLTDAPNVASVGNIYLRDDLHIPGAGNYRLLSDSVQPAPTVPPPFSGFPPFIGAYMNGVGTNVADASADFSHVIFESRLGLTADVPMPPSSSAVLASQPKLYESVEGVVRYVGRVPSSGAFCDDAGTPVCEAAEGSQAGLGTGNYTEDTISRDGSRIFFTTPDGNLYIREDGERTYQLNASEKAPPDSPQPAAFWDASADGSRAFFSTNEQLLKEDEDTRSDLYMYDVDRPEGERLTLISASSVTDGEVNFAIGSSADGRYVYFVSFGQLVPGEPPAFFGLYLWHDGDLSYIGFFSNSGTSNSPQSDWHFIATSRRSRISPDGRHLLFETSSDEGFKGRGGFTGYEHDGHGELYLYDADSGRLHCASCNPAGTPATAQNAYPDTRFLGVGATATVTSTANPTQALSDDGRYIFFSTEEGLLPGDTNGVFDAYVYDSQSEEVNLLSSGEDDQPSVFMDAAPDGRDVFFATSEQLSRWDTDNSYDIYDARVGGGLPEPKLPPPSCQGDACQPAPRALNDPTPASSSFKGAGNAINSRCPVGKRKVKARNGKSRCVKQRKKNRKQHRHANNNRRAGR